MEVANVLRAIRKERGLFQREVAEIVGCLPATYKAIEYGNAGHRSKAMKSMIKNNFFTLSEREELEEQFGKLRRRELREKQADDKLSPNKKNNTTRAKKKAQQMHEVRSKSEHRIPNIPNFYVDLNALGDLQEIDINDPRLQDLREAVGQTRVYKGSSYKNNKYKARNELGSRLKRIRVSDGMDVKNFSRALKMDDTSYRQVEQGRKSSKSSVLKKVVEHSYFTAKDSRDLSDLYLDVQEEDANLSMEKVERG